MSCGSDRRQRLSLEYLDIHRSLLCVACLLTNAVESGLRDLHGFICFPISFNSLVRFRVLSISFAVALTYEESTSQSRYQHLLPANVPCYSSKK